MAYSLRCPTCREKFPWKPTDGMPDECPLCQSVVASDRPDDEICLPAIQLQATKNNDKLYRDIERGSEVRMQIAADKLGVPVSEMSDMKVTNMNDRRDAEIAAMPVRNAVTEQMERASQHGGNYGFQQTLGQPSPGQTFGPGVRTGAVVIDGKVVGNNVEPMAGARTHAALKRMMGT